jgi:hypothetical protein
MFKAGDKVDVAGTSVGKGFQGAAAAVGGAPLGGGGGGAPPAASLLP